MFLVLRLVSSSLITTIYPSKFVLFTVFFPYFGDSLASVLFLLVPRVDGLAIRPFLTCPTERLRQKKCCTDRLNIFINRLKSDNQHASKSSEIDINNKRNPPSSETWGSFPSGLFQRRCTGRLRTLDLFISL